MKATLLNGADDAVAALLLGLVEQLVDARDERDAVVVIARDDGADAEADGNLVRCFGFFVRDVRTADQAAAAFGDHAEFTAPPWPDHGDRLHNKRGWSDHCSR